MHESMFWTNFSGCLVAILLALVTGHLMNGLKFCSKHPPVRHRLHLVGNI